jgi:hypothetical protein
MEFAKQPRLMHDSTLGRFRYHKMETSTSIRVLALDPGTSNEPLRGRLQHFDLELESPIFVALPYVWGAVVYDRSVECQSSIVTITKSLEEAFQRNHSPHKTRHIWADGICINQHDIPERESQVKLVGQIYTRAKLVKIWVGPDTNYVARKAFSLLKECTSPIYSLNTTAMRDPAMDWSLLAELSKLEYFKRLWVRRIPSHEIC